MPRWNSSVELCINKKIVRTFVLYCTSLPLLSGKKWRKKIKEEYLAQYYWKKYLSQSHQDDFSSLRDSLRYGKQTMSSTIWLVAQPLVLSLPTLGQLAIEPTLANLANAFKDVSVLKEKFKCQQLLLQNLWSKSNTL